MAVTTFDNAGLSRRQLPGQSTAEGARRYGHPGNMPIDESAPFQPLDLDIVSAAIPAFFIGRNKDGFWVARDTKGEAGGLFLFETSALAFARRHSRPMGCATIYPLEGFELDLKNKGNPLVVHLGPLKRLAMRAWQRIAALTGR